MQIFTEMGAEKVLLLKACGARSVRRSAIGFDGVVAGTQRWQVKRVSYVHGCEGRLRSKLVFDGGDIHCLYGVEIGKHPVGTSVLTSSSSRSLMFS